MPQPGNGDRGHIAAQDHVDELVKEIGALRDEVAELQSSSAIVTQAE